MRKRPQQLAHASAGQAHLDGPSEVRRRLLELKKLAAASKHIGLYGDRARASRELDAALASSSAEHIQHLLAPTGNLQELANENGWGDLFCALANQLERLVEST